MRNTSRLFFLPTIHDILAFSKLEDQVFHLGALAGSQGPEFHPAASYPVILGIFVPPLIFEAAFHLKFEDLRRNLPLILLTVVFRGFFAVYQLYKALYPYPLDELRDSII